MLDPLHWSTDPLLYDKDCTNFPHWITANKLVEKNQIDKIFLDQDSLTLNLFPILVHRIDFVRKKTSDRILSRFPFLVLTDEEKHRIKEKDLLISEVARNYFYKSVNKSILEWRIAIRYYINRGAMPFPLVRCAWAHIGIPATFPEYLYFESARGKRYSIPIVLSPKLAYLCGVINGDGHLHRHWLRVVDETKEHIMLLSKLFDSVFSDAGRVFKTGNAWNIELRSSSAVCLFNFLTDHTIQGAKYDSLREPLLFKHFGEPFRSLYWRGAMDADGSFKKGINFCSASEKYIEDFQHYLQEYNIKTKKTQLNSGPYLISLPIKYTSAYANLIGVLNPKKMQDFYQLIQRRRYSTKFKGINNQTLTSDGYFDFTKLIGITVLGLDDYLISIRNNRSYTEMRKLLQLSQSSYSNYEKNKHATPITLFQKIVNTNLEQNSSVMQILAEHYKHITFQISTSKPLKLPLQPTSKLLELLPYLEPREKYVNICDNGQEVSQLFYDNFATLVKGVRFVNHLLAKYLRTFIMYQPEEQIINAEQFTLLRKKWKNELLK